MGASNVVGICVGVPVAVVVRMARMVAVVPRRTAPFRARARVLRSAPGAGLTVVGVAMVVVMAVVVLVVAVRGKSDWVAASWKEDNSREVVDMKARRDAMRSNIERADPHATLWAQASRQLIQRFNLYVSLWRILLVATERD